MIENKMTIEQCLRKCKWYILLQLKFKCNTYCVIDLTKRKKRK